MISSRRIFWVLVLSLLGLTGCGYNGTLLLDSALAKFLDAIGTQSGNSVVSHLQPTST